MGAEDKAKQHLFSGAWLPSLPAVLIGPENFSRLENLRYTDQSIKGVLGYSRINETVLPDGYIYIRNGHQLRTATGDEFILARSITGIVVTTEAEIGIFKPCHSVLVAVTELSNLKQITKLVKRGAVNP